MAQSNPKPVLRTVLFGSFLVANTFVFLPVTLYVGNQDAFIMPIWRILEMFTIPAFGIMTVIVLVGLIIDGSIYRRYSMFIAMLGLLVWLQGNVLVWDYGLLDGQSIDWSQGSLRGWVDLAIWIGAIACAVCFYRTLEKPAAYMLVGLFFLQAVLLVILVAQNATELREKTEPQQYAADLEQIYRFSAKQNVVHMVLDGFQSEVFQSIVMDSEMGDRYRSALEGFVFYPNNLGAFQTTFMTVPAILSGEVYRNHMPKGDFVKSVIGGKTVLSAAQEAGYEVDLVSEEFIIGMYDNAPHAHSYLIPNYYDVDAISYVWDDIAELLDLTLFRLAPHFLKSFVYNDQQWLIRSALGQSKFQHYYYFSHTAFLRDLIEGMSADRKSPVYKLFHIMPTHWPMVVDDNCRFVGGTLERTWETVTNQSKCSLNFVVEMLERMKALEIYDDALIVLMADHGAGILPKTIYVESRPKAPDEFVVSPMVVGMATPLMAIKLPGASGELRSSSAPTSLLDTAATISSALGLEARFEGRPIFELQPDEVRERRHYFYEWTREDWASDYTAPILEMTINGPIYRLSSWQPVRRFLPPTSKEDSASWKNVDMPWQ